MYNIDTFTLACSFHILRRPTKCLSLIPLLAPLLNIYHIFADLSEQFPDIFPTLWFNRTTPDDDYAYSKPLDSALQHLIPFSISIPSPSFQRLELTRDQAEAHLKCLQKKYPQVIEELAPVGKALVERIRHYSNRH